MLIAQAGERRGKGRGSRGAGLFGLAFAVAMLGWHDGALSGRFLDCRDIQRDGRNQIVVGEVGLTSAGDPATAELARRRLHQRIRQQLADLASSPGAAVYLVPCPGHAPNRSDYTRDIVARRYGYGVLVEFWGVASGTDAAITYALLPLLAFPASQGTGLAGFYDLGYRINAQAGIAGVFAEAIELRAFTALTVGLHALAEAESERRGELYDRAYATLCKAVGLLDKADHLAGPDDPGHGDWAALLAVAKTSARAAVAGAAAVSTVGGATLARPPAGVSLVDCEVPPPDPALPPLASLDRATPQ